MVQMRRTTRTKSFVPIAIHGSAYFNTCGAERMQDGRSPIIKASSLHAELGFAGITQ